jgi:hypothetical protein
MEHTLKLQLALEVPPALPADLVTRIHDARYSGKLSDAAHDVLYLLVDHPNGPRSGKGKALKIADMQRCFTLAGTHVWDERSIKAAVKSLIEDHNIPVGSSRSMSCPGYYLIASEEDLIAAERPIRAEIISLAKRLRTFNPKSDFARHLAGQEYLTQTKESQ